MKMLIVFFVDYWFGCFGSVSFFVDSCYYFVDFVFFMEI